MSNATGGPVDRLVKERWIEIGLSQADLAEVLGATFQQASRDDAGSNNPGAPRLVQVAEALRVPLEPFPGQAAKDKQKNPVLSSPHNMSSLQSLLELRLLRAFHELRDHRAKRILVRLAERINKRQVDRHGDAG